MKVAIFDTHRFEREFIEETNRKYGHELTFFDTRLNRKTVNLAQGHDCVCCFVNDDLDSDVLSALRVFGIELVALRSAGFNNVDLEAAESLKIKIVRVPAYSPHAVAEHAVALLLAVNRKIHKSYIRVRESNFSLDGLVGFDLYQKTVGVLGTGKIGAAFARIMRGFGCKVLAYDPYKNAELESYGIVEYVDLETLYKKSRVISLHLPLTEQSKHIINRDVLNKLQPGAILINSSRGGLIDSAALVDSLKAGHLGGAGLDVYEEEEEVFFHDLSDQVLQDDVLARLLTFPNVVITSHQGFLTEEALKSIAQTTLQNIVDVKNSGTCANQL